MRSLVSAAGILLLSLSAAQPGLVGSDLRQIEVMPAAGARIPVDSQWQSESGAPVSIGQAMAGRPTLLLFADYTCSTLCGPVLTFVVDALGKSGLPPRDYRLVVLGIDPNDGPGDAAAMKRERITQGDIASAAIFLTGDQSTIQQAAAAVGYRFAYDAARQQFAHPAAVLVLTGDGHLARVLSGLGITADDFRLALVEAGEGRIGTLRDQVRLLCYGFDPSIGVYTLSIYRALALAAAATVLALSVGIGWLSLRHPSAGRSGR